jgi:SAM-dependent methyltransferase
MRASSRGPQAICMPDPAPAGPLHPNHEFLLSAAARATGPTLDFGCGSGEVVIAGRAMGIDIVGAETFYEGGSTREDVTAAGLLGSAVHEIVDGRLPFADGHFGLVVNNQVFEHVTDLDGALSEINRVLRPGGTVVSLFPSRDVWREGHIGIPFAHRFSTSFPLRRPYVLGLRKLGLGANKGDKAASQWTDDALEWLDRYCVYRTLPTIRAAFERHFAITSGEHEFLAFRLERSRMRRLAPVVRRMRIDRFVVRKMAGLVLIGTKPLGPSSPLGESSGAPPQSARS